MSYSGLQGRVHRMLQNVPWTRERREKDRAIVLLLTSNKIPVGIPVAKEYVMGQTEMVEFVRDYNACDRYWRLLIAEHKELRGNDYSTKAVVEQRKQLILGYEPNFADNVKKLTTLTA